MNHTPKSATAEQVRMYSNHKLYFLVEVLVTSIFSIVFHLLMSEISINPYVTVGLPVIIGFCILLLAFLKRRNRTAALLKGEQGEIKFTSAL